MISFAAELMIFIPMAAKGSDLPAALFVAVLNDIGQNFLDADRREESSPLIEVMPFAEQPHLFARQHSFLHRINRISNHVAHGWIEGIIQPLEPPTACSGGGFLLHRYSLPAKTCLCQAVTIGSTGVDFGQFLP